MRRGFGGVQLCGHFRFPFAAKRGSPRGLAALQRERSE